jgi:tetrahydromethanopterin S-methyltransferase subunit F
MHTKIKVPLMKNLSNIKMKIEKLKYRIQCPTNLLRLLISSVFV